VRKFKRIKKKRNYKERFMVTNSKRYDIPLLPVDEESNYFTIEFLQIPGIILKVWGKMTYQKYQILLENPSFLGVKTKVC